MADINQPIDLLPAFDWQQDVVFILSAILSRVTREQASGMALAINLGGINNVLELCKRVSAHAVSFSTSEAYGRECNRMDEGLSQLRPNT